MAKRFYKIPLPDWVNWIATDLSGRVYGYERKPEPNYEQGEWDDRSDGETISINSFDSAQKNAKWFETLKHIDK